MDHPITHIEIPAPDMYSNEVLFGSIRMESRFNA